MHHGSTFLQSYLLKTFSRPTVTLQKLVQRRCCDTSQTGLLFGCRGYSFSSDTQRSIRSASIQSQYPSRAISRSLPYAVQTRRYTARPGEFGNLSENDFQKHSHRFRELSLHEIRQIFGSGMSKKKGNDLLSRLQKRRITGTLDHEMRASSTDPNTTAKALAWLRKSYPLDEDAAIVKRIEREEGENEKKFIEEAERLKNWHPQQSAAKDGIYGKPMVDEFAKIWNARAAEKQRMKAEQRRQYEEFKAEYAAKRITDSRNSPAAELTEAGGRALYAGKREEAEWIKRYKEKGKLSDMLEPPKMSTLQRLGPSYAFAAICFAFLVYVAANYVTPPANARLFPDTPVSMATLVTIMNMNVAVFLAWKLPPLWKFLNKNFMCIVATPSARTLLTACFSHQQLPHLLSNMFGMFLVGIFLHEEVGRGGFISIFLTSAICGGLVSLTRQVLVNRLSVTILGASGGICGLIAALAWLPVRSEKGDSFKTLGIDMSPSSETLSTWLWRGALFALIAIELRNARSSTTMLDPWGHLGGYFGGIISAETLLWQARRRKQQRENPRPPLGLQPVPAQPKYIQHK